MKAPGYLFLAIATFSALSSFAQVKPAHNSASFCDTSSLKASNFGLLAYTSYYEGLDCATKTGRPTLLYFNGVYCMNSRKMETTVFKDPQVRYTIESRFVFINLYCDDPAPLKKGTRQFSKSADKHFKTTGEYNATLEADIYKRNSQPLFILLDKNGKKIAETSYTTDANEFKAFLAKAR